MPPAVSALPFSASAVPAPFYPARFLSAASYFRHSLLRLVLRRSALHCSCSSDFRRSPSFSYVPRFLPVLYFVHSFVFLPLFLPSKLFLSVLRTSYSHSVIISFFVFFRNNSETFPSQYPVCPNFETLAHRFHTPISSSFRSAASTTLSIS